MGQYSLGLKTETLDQTLLGFATSSPFLVLVTMDKSFNVSQCPSFVICEMGLIMVPTAYNHLAD